MIALALVLALTAAAPAGSPAPAQEVVIEAEGFHVDKGPWRVIDQSEAYYAATMSNTFTSRQRLLAAPAQGPEAVARYQAKIPTAGAYRIWSRYECPSHWSVEHTIRIEQGGHVVLERTYGRLENRKLWPMHEGFVPMANFSWGSGDNIVWEPSDEPIALAAGPARITLSTGPQAEKADGHGAAERHIDALLLTTDVNFGLEHPEAQTWHVLDRVLNQKGECYLRLRNPKGAAPLSATLSINNHSPYQRPREPLPPLACANGGQDKPANCRGVPSHRSGAWIAIGQALDSTNMQELIVTAPGPRPLGFTVELASDPEGKHVLERFAHRGDGPLVIEIPPDLRGPKPIVRTVEQWQSDLVAYLRSLPPRAAGPPREVPVLGIAGKEGYWGGLPGELPHLLAETALLLGRNSWKHGTLPDDLVAAYHPQFRDNLLIDVRSILTPKLEAALRGMQTSGALAQVSMVSLGDEIAVGGVDAKSAAESAEFARYLDQAGIIQPGLALTLDPTKPQAYYWSRRFGVDRDIDQLAERTRIVQKVMGPDVQTGANYSPHPQYFPISGPWMHVFRRGGMTMPWSEDYLFQVPEASPLISGYLCDVMRAATRLRGAPVHMYNMPHFPGNTARDFTLSVYTSLAHGSRILDFFGASPIYEATENWVAWDARPTWKAIRDVVHDVGEADDIIAHGRVRPADVALLMSDADDIWEQAHHASLYNFERKSLYHLLRHAQIPVDFVGDEDVADLTFLRRYKVILVSAGHLARVTARNLRRWVDAGGHLIGVAGAGEADEYEAPLALLDELFGLEKAETRTTEKNVFAKEGLAWLPPLAQLAGQARPIPALAAVDRLTPNVGTVVARFATGEPAIVQNRFGRGTATRFAFFPGAAYLQPAIPRRPYHRGTTDAAFNHFLPTAFNQEAARLVLRAVEDASITRPVTAHVEGASGPEPPLDLGVIDAPGATAVVITNFSGQPLRAVTVRVHLPGRAREVRAARAGTLTSQRTGDTVSVTLPVDWADVVMFRD